MSDKKSVVRRPYHGAYKDALTEPDDDENSESEINVSESDNEPSEETATSVENPSEEVTETDESSESEETTSITSPVDPEASVWKKRYDDARRYHNKLITRTKQLEEQLKLKGDVSLPKTKEEIDDWRTKYPDVYDMVSSIASLQSEDKNTRVQKQLEEVSQAQEEIAFERAYNKIVKVHSDFDELTNSSEFHTWAETQPDTIQKALYENRADSAAAIRAIDLYKYDQRPTKQKANSKKDAATAVTKTKTSEPVEGKEPKVWTEKEIQALSDAEYEKLEEVIDIAAREGRVIAA